MGYFLNKFGISLTSILEAEVDGEDMNKDNDEVEDYSADENDTNETNKESNDDDNPDQDVDETDQESNEEQTDNQGEDNTTDYTEEGQDDDEDNSDESSEDSGDNNDSSDEEDGYAVDDIKRQEEELYSNMSPEELDIKHKELKMQYINMYDKIEDIIERINNTNVTEINSHVVNYISTTLFNLKKTLTDYLTDVYSMKSYIENSINYNRNLAVLNGIKEILEQLAKNEDK